MKPEFLRIEEVVPPALFHELPARKLWLLFDDRILHAFDELRRIYGPITINDWFWGGKRTQSGFRMPGSNYYSLTSQHAHGRALDGIPKETSVETIRRDIMDRKYEFMKQIKGLELDVSWLHFDCRPTKEIVTFKPN